MQINEWGWQAGSLGGPGYFPGAKLLVKVVSLIIIASPAWRMRAGGTAWLISTSPHNKPCVPLGCGAAGVEDAMCDILGSTADFFH